MREILFRAKRLDNGEWVEGFLICPLFDKSRAYIGTLFAVDDHDTDVAEVDPETVGQYTGLKDKNGVRIFEGDILKIADSERRTVSVVRYGKYKPDMFYQAVAVAFGICFESELVGLYLENLASKTQRLWKNPEDKQMCITPLVEKRAKIIGNIYDDPELLKGGESNE